MSLKTLITIASIVFSQLVFSQNSLELYNNTDKMIYACYAYYDYSNKCWSTVGWYKVESYSTTTINLGNYSNDVYIHGYSVNEGTFRVSETYNRWGSGFSFCVDPKNKFNIRYADKSNCENKRSFTQRKIVAGVNKWTFNF